MHILTYFEIKHINFQSNLGTSQCCTSALPSYERNLCSKRLYRLCQNQYQHLLLWEIRNVTGKAFAKAFSMFQLIYYSMFAVDLRQEGKLNVSS